MDDSAASDPRAAPAIFTCTSVRIAIVHPPIATNDATTTEATTAITSTIQQATYGTAPPLAALIFVLQLRELAMSVIAVETPEQLSRALGDAVVRIWGHLPLAFKTSYSKRR